MAGILALFQSSKWIENFQGAGSHRSRLVRAVVDLIECLINFSGASTQNWLLYGIDEVVNTARVSMGIDSISFDEGGYTTQSYGCPSSGLWRELQGEHLILRLHTVQTACQMSMRRLGFAVGMLSSMNPLPCLLDRSKLSCRSAEGLRHCASFWHGSSCW